ncbi:ATP-binding cassette domain-containing protein [Verticiella sediminum]|uniref:ATP-binding cassette domain-containing protein n=1 Tax=Verticiella sediminum TaxID=1247510 RepID=A0A556AGT6_9BURK|nr:oligopeptide/dipeptide ABC transporter ATP-binding protein [Verticiella sediminum]TSH92095.1 ATP-binding cassette domain-containing protein [Verticiella sediminum]
MPDTASAATATQAPPILEVDDLAVHFPVTKGGFFQRQVGAIKAVDGVSFTLRKGETLGLVGESGCGKSTTGLAVLGLSPITRGRVRFEGHDVNHLSGAETLRFRRRAQMVYQDPYGSLNPRMTVEEIVSEPLRIHNHPGGAPVRRKRVAELLDLVGLLPAMAQRYPHEFSGGQRQRIGIARAIALEPDLIVCDESVSALDVSIQAQVVNLFMDLQKQLGLTYIFIAHDLAVVRHISNRVAVMYLGRIVEIADRDDLYDDPKHPYTQALLSAIPVADPVVEASRARVKLTGEVPSVMKPPSGCRFHPRCPHAMPVCKTQDPPLRPLGAGLRSVACHLHDPAIVKGHA